MSFNYDLMTWIEYFLGAFACCISMFFVSSIMLKKNLKEINPIRCLLLIPFSIIIILYSTNFDNIIKIFCSLTIFYLIHKIILKEKNIICIVYSATDYIIFIIGEIVCVSIISLLKGLFEIDFLYLLSKSIIGNILIGGVSCAVSLMLKNKINIYIVKLTKYKTVLILLQSFVVIFTAISSINYLYMNHWKFNYNFVLNAIIVLGSIILFQSLLKQYINNKEIVDKYTLLEEYMKTSADLVAKYSSTVHKYKNNLIAIKGYYKKNKSDGDNYIDSLLENYQTKKYSWFNVINNISFDSIRYLIYYKLSKAEEMNLKIFVNVDKNIKNIENNLLDMNNTSVILEILGEYFDNAIYASNESKEKELNFNVYLSDSKINFELANTFLKSVDINSIYKNGYTTKGKGHGFGLYDVNKSIKNNNYLDGKIEILNNYFISRLIIDLKCLIK